MHLPVLKASLPRLSASSDAQPASASSSNPHRRPARSSHFAALAALVLAATTVRAGTLYLANLSGANEIPPTTSTASGLGVLILNDQETQGVITATHNISLPLTGGHIHRGAANANGPVIFPFDAPSSPVGPLTWAIPAADVANLKNLGLYMNFHTGVNPGGAIRGQLVRAVLAPAAADATQARLAGVLDVSAGFDADLDRVLIQTNLATPAVQARTLQELSARTVYVQSFQQLEAMASLTDSLFAHAAETRAVPASAAQTSGFFLAGGDFGKRGRSVNRADSIFARPYVAGGVDFGINPTIRGGVAVGYVWNEDRFKGGSDETTSRTTTLHAFISTTLGTTGVMLDGVAGYGQADITATRNLVTLSRAATTETDGTVWSAALRASKAIILQNQTTLIPYASIDARQVRIDGYREVGASSAGLVIPRRTTWNSALEGGATLIVPVEFHAHKLTARLQAGWSHLIEDGAGNFGTRLIGSPIGFATTVEGAGENSAHFESSLTTELGKGTLGTVAYRGRWGSQGYTVHAAEARIAVKF